MLVAEDKDQDIEILKLAFSRAGIKLPLHFARDGEEVIDYLKGDGRFANRNEYPLPKLLLLDLNMPRRNGFEVLEWLRLQPGLRRLVVVVFTCSNLREDINRAFDLGANSYVLKPSQFEKLEEIGRYLERYWLLVNQCPDCTEQQTPTGSLKGLLLRNLSTQLYLSGPHQWTDDPALALVFERSELAVRYALQSGLRHFELVAETGATS